MQKNINTYSKIKNMCISKKKTKNVKAKKHIYLSLTICKNKCFNKNKHKKREHLGEFS